MKIQLFFIIIFLIIQTILATGEDLCQSYSYNGEAPLFRFQKNGCRYFSNINKCDACLDGFYLYQNSECKSCKEIFGEDVKKCQVSPDPSQIAMITECNEGYYIYTAYSQCKKCSAGCKTCTDEFKCDQCFPDFQKINNSCTPCPQNPQQCCVFAPNHMNCEQCNSKYFLNKINNLCQQCMNNCVECDSNTECLKCEDQYFYDKTLKKCVNNPPNCKQACKTPSNKLLCVECNKDPLIAYFSNDLGQCEPCSIANCQECATPNSCMICDPSYTKMKTKTNQELCFNCQVNCSRCQMQGSIKTCFECLDPTIQPSKRNQCILPLQFQSEVVVSQYHSIISFAVIQLIYLFVLFNL